MAVAPPRALATALGSRLYRPTLQVCLRFLLLLLLLLL